MIAAASELLAGHLALFVLVLTRISTLIIALPALGSGVPQRIRALLALTVSFLIVPVLTQQLPADELPGFNHMLELAIAIAREALIGLLIGTIVQYLITGIQMAGELIASTGSMQLGDAVDPTTQARTPTLAQLIGLLVSSLFVIAGGHRLVMEALLDSFVAMRPGQVEFHTEMLTFIIEELSHGFAAGIRLAAPVVAALLLVNLLTGIISRTLPGLNLLAIGLNLNAMTVLVFSAMAIGSAGYLFSGQLARTFDRLAGMW